MVAATRHDLFAAEDYRRVQEVGMYTVRDGIRWHLIETRPYHYDFSSVVPMIRAAREAGTQVIWDLFHYGWPVDLDIFRPEFVYRLRSLARNFAKVLQDETDETPYICPINEISFIAWGAGDHAFLNPFERGRGFELKTQLVRAAIESIEALWTVNPATRIAVIDPVINVVPANPDDSADVHESNRYTEVQFEAWDMLAGRRWPQLGGDEKYLDIIGLNYYVHNQWVNQGKWIPHTHPAYKPFRAIVSDVYQRYGRPLFVAETGIEDADRPTWLAYVAGEVNAAIESGVPVEGICLYPVVNHPGWEDERHCHNGLFDYCNDSGHREIYSPLADEIRRQSARIQETRKAVSRDRKAFEMLV